MYEHLRAGRLTKAEFVRRAADLGTQSVSIHLPTESEGRKLRLVADEMGVPLGEGIVDFYHEMKPRQANCPDARFTIESGHLPLPDLEESLLA